MKTTLLTISLLITLFLMSCTNSQPKQYNTNNPNIRYAGHIEKLDNEVILINSGSSATIYFEGDTCVLFLRNHNQNELYNFFSIELDDEDLGRFIIDGNEMIAIPIAINFQKDIHKVSVYKSTEASNGYINFGGILCQKVVEPAPAFEKTIEFIGNSITCGMGNDTLLIACHTNQWYDQHNAYWAYGPTVSRALKVNFLLSSVSGIGIYRNWNDVGLTMPEVYENLYLDNNSNQKRDFSLHSPNIVSIALGTNDFSDGDGVNERLPFDEKEFIETYIAFIETVLSYYPKTQIALLNSPMLKDEKNEQFVKCLKAVKKHFEGSNYKPFAIFEFESFEPQGCDYHPEINDHLLMADQLYNFYSELLKD